MKVVLGNLNVVIGRIKFTSSSDGSDFIIIVVIAVISIALSILMLIIIVIAFKHLKRHCHGDCITASKPLTNEVVNMYASPAYGTHQVFSEPGMDHLCEPIDDCEMHMESTLQDVDPAAGDDDKVDVDGYLKMKSSCEVDDEAATDREGNVGDTGTHFQPNDGENVPLGNNNIAGGDNQKAAQPHGDSDGPLHSDYGNEDEDAPPKCAPYLQVFSDSYRVTGNVTLV